MSHAIPGRTRPLGAISTDMGVDTQIFDSINLQDDPYGYTASNYDHSAQWYQSNAVRKCFWAQTLLSIAYDSTVAFEVRNELCDDGSEN